MDIFLSQPHMFAGPMSPGAESKEYSALRHFINCNLTSEVPHISTRRLQIPDRDIGTLCAECATQKVLNKNEMTILYWRSQSPLLSGRIEGSQTHV